MPFRSAIPLGLLSFHPAPASRFSPPNPPPPPPVRCKLVALTVTSGATQQNVSGSHNWATVQQSDNVIVEATTEPNTSTCWNQIIWTGDTGSAVPGQPNRRQLSPGSSAVFHVRAELGGVSDELAVWVIWSSVQILTSGRRPANAQAHPPPPLGDGSDRLGAIEYDSLAQRQVAGKIVAVATILPRGIHNVVISGWVLRRERWTHDWIDGTRSNPGNGRKNQWNTAWVDDTLAAMSMLTPDLDDKVYDTDAPNLGTALRAFETYNNFRQWLEWNGSRASDNSPWYFQARWQNSRVTLKDVGVGNIRLPDTAFFHP